MAAIHSMKFLCGSHRVGDSRSVTQSVRCASRSEPHFLGWRRIPNDLRLNFNLVVLLGCNQRSWSGYRGIVASLPACRPIRTSLIGDQEENITPAK